MVLREIDCLIIGAGPSGLTLGIGLIKAGKTVLIAEKHTNKLSFSKAILINSKVLRALQNYIKIKELVDRAIIIDGVTLCAEKIFVASAHFDTASAAEYHPIALPQACTEYFLREDFLKLGGQLLAGFIFDPVLDDLEHHVDFEPFEIRLRSEGVPVTVRCQWLFGCDGAHSAVRQALHVNFSGTTDRARLHVLDAVVEAWTLPTHINLYVSLLGSCGAIRVLSEPPTVRIVGVATEDCRKLLRQFKLVEVVWEGTFTNSYRMAETYGRGNVWLAGDAAHVHSPIGGRGMNIGILDAIALAQAVGDGDVWQYEKKCRKPARDWIFANYFLTQLLLSRAVLYTILRAVMIVVLVVLAKILGPRFLALLFEKVASVTVRMQDQRCRQPAVQVPLQEDPLSNGACGRGRC
jgi:2-polyprenyl-6-methoxyphenol hydroxylase-like FAD-dependent oxidoreductase